MSLNSPRPPRPPRPGGTRPNSRPAGPPRTSGIQPGSSASASGKSDFGDTRTVILSRKSMGMHQRKKEEIITPTEQAPMPKAVVVNEHVHCTSCPGSFPILGDEYYGAVVECPDCAAEFIIPTRQELSAVSASSIAAVEPEHEDTFSPIQDEIAVQSQTATASEALSKPPVGPKRKVIRRVPDYVECDLNEGEDVYVCKKEAGSSGIAITAAMMVILTALTGIISVLVDGLSQGVAIAIPVVAGVILAIVTFVLAKGGSGNKVLVVTNKRVFCRSGKWFAESKLD